MEGLIIILVWSNIMAQSSLGFHKTATVKTWVPWEFPTSIRKAQLITPIIITLELLEEQTLPDNTSKSMLWPSRQCSTPDATVDSNLATVQSIRAMLWQETPNSKWNIKTSVILLPIEKTTKGKTVPEACTAVAQDVATLKDHWGPISPLLSD